MSDQGTTSNGNLVLPPIGMLPPTEAQSFLESARQFYYGAEKLNESGSNETAVACTFLCGFATECVLKAYLSHFGVTIQTLKDIGHDLSTLWEKAVGNGLKVVDKTPPAWCAALSQLHNRPFHLRYPMCLNVMNLPAPEEMISGLKDLIDIVENQV